MLLSGPRLQALGVVPPGLPDRPGRHATMVLGVIADGTARRVPMAFGVIEPGGAARPSALRAGALDAGLRALAPGGGSFMEAHRSAIEAVLGRPLAADALYVTADRGLHYRERALYRRAQPGRPWLNRMETDLAMAPAGIADPADPARRHIAGAVSAIAAAIGTDAAVGGTADIGSHAGAAGMTAETIEAGNLDTPSLSVATDLVVGTAVTGALAANAVAASLRLETGALRTAGGVYGPDAAIAGLLTVGSCAGCEGE